MRSGEALAHVIARTYEYDDVGRLATEHTNVDGTDYQLDFLLTARLMSCAIAKLTS